MFTDRTMLKLSNMLLSKMTRLDLDKRFKDTCELADKLSKEGYSIDDIERLLGTYKRSTLYSEAHYDVSCKIGKRELALSDVDKFNMVVAPGFWQIVKKLEQYTNESYVCEKLEVVDNSHVLSIGILSFRLSQRLNVEFEHTLSIDTKIVKS